MLICMCFGCKIGEIDSVYGEYVVGNVVGVCLVIGEYENGGFFMEEFDDGMYVIGIWEGVIDGYGVVCGMWMDVGYDGYMLLFVLWFVVVVVILLYDVVVNSNVVVFVMLMMLLVFVVLGQIVLLFSNLM